MELIHSRGAREVGAQAALSRSVLALDWASSAMISYMVTSPRRLDEGSFTGFIDRERLSPGKIK